MSEIQVSEPVLLWPNGAPGAMGDALADRPQLRLFRPAAATPMACVILCPGGAYAGLAGHEGEPVARWLCSVGVAGAVLQYRLTPYKHPMPLADAKRAIRTVRANASMWNIDPARVGILGFSAGGHVAISAATIQEDAIPPADDIDRLSSRPDALIGCYPVVSMGKFGHGGSRRNLLGQEPDPILVEQLSLENRVGPHTPPTFLWHTAEDKGVPVQNSLMLADALARNGVSFALHVFPKGGHGLGLALQNPSARRWSELCGYWLQDIGFAPTSQ